MGKGRKEGGTKGRATFGHRNLKNSKIRLLIVFSGISVQQYSINSITIDCFYSV